MIDGEATVAAVVAHARAVPAADRERFALALRNGLGDHGLIVQTCHRVEGYAAGADDLARLATVPIPLGASQVRGEAAIRHAVTVAVGRDSVVVGEDQVLHQVRSAVDAARSAGGLDPILERLFGAAMRAGRLARSWRAGPVPSLATVAWAEIAARSGPLERRRVLVVGAGQMGRLAARAAAQLEADVTVANRSAAAAAALARDAGGRSAPLDPGPAVADFAGIVIALSGPWSIGRETTDALATGHLPVVDLSVPSALDEELRGRLGRRLITADDLARADSLAAGAKGLDARTARRLDALIDRTTSGFVDWLDGRARRTVAAALADRAATARETELAALWRQLPALDPEAREAIDAMTKHLADRLLREPLDRLGKDVDGAAERAVREAFAL